MDWDDADRRAGCRQTSKAALACFERVVAALPGEAAPKLASAATAELMLDTDDAPDAEQLRRSAERLLPDVVAHRPFDGERGVRSWPASSPPVAIGPARSMCSTRSR